MKKDLRSRAQLGSSRDAKRARLVRYVGGRMRAWRADLEDKTRVETGKTVLELVVVIVRLWPLTICDGILVPRKQNKPAQLEMLIRPTRALLQQIACVTFSIFKLNLN